MATKIRGITIEIGGDTTGLERALKDVNNEIKGTQRALKDVEKALKLDPTNTELLQQKQQLLKNSVEETSKKLEALKKVEESLDAQGVDRTSTQFIALQREIAVTEEAYQKSKTASDNFSVSQEKLKATLKGVATSAATVAQKTKALSAASAGVLTALGGMVVKGAQAADSLNTLAQQSGLSTESLQKMQYASNLVDVSVDDIISSTKKLKKSMTSSSGDVAAAWERIGVATTDANGELRDIEEVFYDVLAGLSQIENETERDTVAMSLFGKSADQLAGIIDDGGAALRAYGEEATGVLPQEVIDQQHAFNDEIDKLKAKIQGVIALRGAAALEALQPILEKIIDAIGKILDKIANANPTLIKTIAIIAAIVAAISPIAGIVAGINVALAALAANPIALAIAAAILAIAALTLLIVKNWDKIKETIENAKAKVVETVDNIKEKIVGAWNAIKTALGTAFDFLKEKVFEPISKFFRSEINVYIGLINGLIKGVNLLINGLNKIQVDIPDWVPLLGGNTIGFNIPNIKELAYLANGGILSSGSAIVGERGPEILTMTGNRATVTPLEGQMSALTQALQNSGAQNINLNLEIDGKQFARATYRYMAAEGHRLGGSFV